MECATKSYSIQYRDRSIAYLQVQTRTRGELPVASYGREPTELARCQVTDGNASDTHLSVETPYGELLHEFGKNPEWYRSHAVEILNPEPETIDPAVGSKGYILCKIKLGEGEGEAFFCLLDGHEQAFYGQNLQELTKCELVKRVGAARDGGTPNIITEYGNLYIPGSFEEDEQPDWSISHKVNLETQ